MSSSLKPTPIVLRVEIPRSYSSMVSMASSSASASVDQSRHTSQNTPISPFPSPSRPHFLEPLSPTIEPLQKAIIKQNEGKYLEFLMEQAYFWEERIEQLERRREKYNIKGSWSAEDVFATEEIDKEIRFCEENLYKIYN